MKKSLRVAGYARVSTDEQKKFGYSISAQTSEIQQWCNENGHELLHIYIDEGFSASTSKRPNLQKLMNNLQHIDAIAFTRLDRFSRSVLDANKMLELLHQNNVAMISINEDDINTSTANGLFMFNLKVNLAEHELKKGSERIKAVFEYKIAQGQPITGKLPFGYKIITSDGTKKVVKDERTEKIVDDIFSSFLLYQSVHHVVDLVNNKYGLCKPYHFFTRILKNEFYAGMYRGNLNYAEPYITHETRNAVLTALEANIRKGLNRHVYLFTGLIRCPECRSKLTGTSYPRNVDRYYYYRCNIAHSRHVCDHRKTYAEAPLEQYLIANVSSLLGSHIATVQNVTPATIDTTEAEIKNLQSEMERLNIIFMKKRMSVSVYDKMYAELEHKITMLKQKMPKKDNTDALKKFLNSGWENVYHGMTRENKRTLWRNLIKEIHITDHGYEIIFL